MCEFFPTCRPGEERLPAVHGKKASGKYKPHCNKSKCVDKARGRERPEAAQHAPTAAQTTAQPATQPTVQPATSRASCCATGYCPEHMLLHVPQQLLGFKLMSDAEMVMHNHQTDFHESRQQPMFLARGEYGFTDDHDQLTGSVNRTAWVDAETINNSYLGDDGDAVADDIYLEHGEPCIRTPPARLFPIDPSALASARCQLSPCQPAMSLR